MGVKVKFRTTESDCTIFNNYLLMTSGIITTLVLLILSIVGLPIFLVEKIFNKIKSLTN